RIYIADSYKKGHIRHKNHIRHKKNLFSYSAKFFFVALCDFCAFCGRKCLGPDALSPSHPGPYKATHLAMCDRTVNLWRLVTPAPVVSQFVRVERCSTSA